MSHPGGLSEQLHHAALDAPDQLGVPLAQLQARGRRARRRRTAATAATGGLLGVLAVTALALAPHARHSPPLPPASSAAPATGRPTARPFGAPVVTDVALGQGTFALWFQQNVGHGTTAPSLVVGERTPDGQLHVDAVDTEPLVTPPQPGFPTHDVTTGIYDGMHPEVRFGYVVGDVASVHLTLDGAPRTATVASWSVDPAVHLWWIVDPQPPSARLGKPAAQLTQLTAYNARGIVTASNPGDSVDR